MITTDTYREAEARHPDELRQIARDRRTARERLRTYPDESLLAAVATHARNCGFTLDLAYRTTCGAPAELLIGEAQLGDLIAELERRDVCGASDLFTNPAFFSVKGLLLWCPKIVRGLNDERRSYRFWIDYVLRLRARLGALETVERALRAEPPVLHDLLSDEETRG